jgi:hypothetical protein
MTIWSRFLLGLSVLLASLAGLCQAQPQWLHNVGLGWLASVDTGEDEQARRARLQRHGDIVLRRILAKQSVIRQLIDGQLTLFEAAALFGRLNQMGESSEPQVDLHPGASKGEKLCRQVIRWVRGSLPQSKAPDLQSEADAFVAELEAELAEHLAQHGTVVLPEE